MKVDVKFFELSVAVVAAVDNAEFRRYRRDTAGLLRSTLFWSFPGRSEWWSDRVVVAVVGVR